MDKKQLYDDVRAMVKEIFSEQEDIDKQKKVEDALNKSALAITDLNDSLKRANDKIDSLEDLSAEANETIASNEDTIRELGEEKERLATQLTEANEKIDQLTKDLEEAESVKTELEGLKTSKAELEEQLNDANQKLELIEKTKIAEARYAELTEAKVNSSDKDKQMGLLMDKTDEEFEAYKAELVAIREDIVKHLNDDNASNGSDSDDSQNDDTSTDSASLFANVDQNVIFAALNAELGKEGDLVARYRALGEAMAEDIKKRRE